MEDVGPGGMKTTKVEYRKNITEMITPTIWTKKVPVFPMVEDLMVAEAVINNGIRQNQEIS